MSKTASRFIVCICNDEIVTYFQVYLLPQVARNGCGHGYTHMSSAGNTNSTVNMTHYNTASNYFLYLLLWLRYSTKNDRKISILVSLFLRQSFHFSLQGCRLFGLFFKHRVRVKMFVYGSSKRVKFGRRRISGSHGENPCFRFLVMLTLLTNNIEITSVNLNQAMCAHVPSTCVC